MIRCSKCLNMKRKCMCNIGDGWAVTYKVESHKKLAICVYHRISDLWELPLMMHEMEPGHKLYLRHHTPVYCETVCYSLPC